MSCCSEVMKPIAASSCCTPQDTAAHAARAIRDSGCGCAPVVADTANRKLVGVVTLSGHVAADGDKSKAESIAKIHRGGPSCGKPD